MSSGLSGGTYAGRMGDDEKMGLGGGERVPWLVLGPQQRDLGRPEGADEKMGAGVLVGLGRGSPDLSSGLSGGT